MKKQKVPQHNYIRKLHYLYRIGAIPSTVGVHQLSIYHDGWCGIFQYKGCDCDPDIRVRWSHPTAAQN